MIQSLPLFVYVHDHGHIHSIPGATERRLRLGGHPYTPSPANAGQLSSAPPAKAKQCRHRECAPTTTTFDPITHPLQTRNTTIYRGSARAQAAVARQRIPRAERRRGLDLTSAPSTPRVPKEELRRALSFTGRHAQVHPRNQRQLTTQEGKLAALTRTPHPQRLPPLPPRKPSETSKPVPTQQTDEPGAPVGADSHRTL